MSSNGIEFIKKIKPYNIKKGIRYLKHFGLKEFMIRLRERMEAEEIPYGPWYENYKPTEAELEKQRKRIWKHSITFSIVVQPLSVYNSHTMDLQKLGIVHCKCQSGRRTDGSSACGICRERQPHKNKETVGQ